MTRLLVALTAVALVQGVGSAQLGMPGQTVSTPAAQPILKPVGTRLPAAAPQAGTPITGLATQQPGVVGPGAPGAGQ